jgi:hypothetical protein
MAVSKASYLKGLFSKAQALGKKVISSDFCLEIEGFEGTYLLCKQAPWPQISSAGEIELSGPLGMTMYQPQQVKVAQQGQVSFSEVTAGSIDQMLVDLIAQGGTFNCKVYEGVPTKYLRYKPLIECFLQMDNPDRDWENRSQPLLFSGTMFFHYFGEVVEGNSKDYA